MADRHTGTDPVHPPSPPQLAVGAVCLRDGRLLLVQRGRGVAIGSWSLPGGRVEHGELLEAAVLRELQEETGLEGSVQGLCGIAERIFSGSHFVILDYWVTTDSRDPRAGDDAAAVRWVARPQLDELDLVPRLREFLDEHGVLERMTD